MAVDLDKIEVECQVKATDVFQTLVRINWRKYGGLFFLLSFNLAVNCSSKAIAQKEMTSDLLQFYLYTLICGIACFHLPVSSAWLFLKNRRLESTAYCFGPEGIDIVADGRTTHMDWQDYREIQETSDFVTIFAPRDCPHLIAKAALGDRIESLKQMLARNLQPRKIEWRLGRW